MKLNNLNVCDRPAIKEYLVGIVNDSEDFELTCSTANKSHAISHAKDCQRLNPSQKYAIVERITEHSLVYVPELCHETI